MPSWYIAGNERLSGCAGIVPSYQGPGDFMTTPPYAWYGFRGYTNAYAGPAIDIVSGAYTATINIVNNYIDDAAILAFLNAHGGIGSARISAIYDQTGNGVHLFRNGAGAAAQLKASGLLSHYTYYTVQGTNHTEMIGGSISALPVSISLFVQRETGGTDSIVGSQTGGLCVYVASLYNGTTLNSTGITNDTWYSHHAVFNTTTSTSVIDIDGSSATGNAGTSGGLAGKAICLGRDAFANWSSLIRVAEMGWWNSKAFTGPEIIALKNNQHAMWGV